MIRNSLRLVSRNLQKPIITTPRHPSFFTPQRSTHNVLNFQQRSLPVSLFRRNFHSTQGLASEKQNEQTDKSQNKDTKGEPQEEPQAENQTPPEGQEQPKGMSRLKWAMIIGGALSAGAVALSLSSGFDHYFELHLDDEKYYDCDRAKGGFIYFLDRLWFMGSNPHITKKYRLIPASTYPCYTLVIDTTDMIHLGNDITKIGHRAWIRPHVPDFLGSLSREMEIILWSTHVDPQITDRLLEMFEGAFAGVLTRFETYNLGIHVYKDLNRLNRPMSQIILVTSDPEYGALQPDNTILIPPYSSVDPEDETFQQLHEILMGIVQNYPVGQIDVRAVLGSFAWRNPLESHVESSKHAKTLFLRDRYNSFNVHQHDTCE